jgi:Helix-turn-helix domain
LRKNRRPWLPEELAAAARILADPGATLNGAASELGRTPLGVKMALKRYRVKVRKRRPLSARAVQRHLGMRNPRRIGGWLRSGLLPATRLPSRAWAIYGEDLIAFLERHPQEYDWRLVPQHVDGSPNPYHRHARAYDPVAGLLTPKQAGAILGIGPEAVRRRCRIGLLPLERRVGCGITGRQYFIPRAAVLRLVESRRAA